MTTPATFSNAIVNGVVYNHNDSIVFTQRLPTITLSHADTSTVDGIRIQVSEGTVFGVDNYFTEIRIPKNECVVTPTTLSYTLDSWVLRHNRINSYVTILFSAYHDGDSSAYLQLDATLNLTSGSENSWQNLTRQVLIDTMVANFTVDELALITENTAPKIFWEGVGEEWDQPYIVLQIITGGDLNSGQVAYAEMLWRVVIHTPSLATAGTMENAIHKALARKNPVINFSGVSSAGEIEEVTPVTDRYQVQNVPLYVSGGIYRIRLAKG